MASIRMNWSMTLSGLLTLVFLLSSVRFLSLILINTNDCNSLRYKERRNIGRSDIYRTQYYPSSTMNESYQNDADSTYKMNDFNNGYNKNNNNSRDIRARLQPNVSEIMGFEYSRGIGSLPVIGSAKYHAKRSHYTRFCAAIMEGDLAAYNQAKQLMRAHPEFRIPRDNDLSEDLWDCQSFKFDKGYPEHATSKEANEFPIAYSIVIHTDMGQVERLLRVIYQPQNVYCLHVDKKSPIETHKAARALSNCFPNVFMASKQETVIYATFSRLRADLNCMEDLLRTPKKWRYLINLTGQVFPLKTNEELVKILKIYNGANDIEGINRRYLLDVMKRYTYRWVVNPKSGNIIKTKREKSDPPHNITLVKGSAFGSFSREFIEFVFRDRKTQDFLEWSMDTYSPDEIFWASLNVRWVNSMLEAPGAFTGGVPDRKPWLAMFASWASDKACSWKYVHNVCILTLRDLPLLISIPHLFANKFYKSEEPMTFDCIEYWLYNKTQSGIPFSNYYYKQLPFLYHS